MHPEHPLITPDTSVTTTNSPLHPPSIRQKSLTLSQKVDECKPLARGSEHSIGKTASADIEAAMVGPPRYYSIMSISLFV